MTTDDRPPLEMSDAEMKAAYPDLGPKMTLVWLDGGAAYAKHGSGWVLLDARSHGYGRGDDAQA